MNVKKSYTCCANSKLLEISDPDTVVAAAALCSVTLMTSPAVALPSAASPTLDNSNM